MKSLTVKIIIAVLSTLVVAGSVFGVLIATGVIEFASVDDDDDDDEKSSYVQKDKDEDEDEDEDEE